MIQPILRSRSQNHWSVYLFFICMPLLLMLGCVSTADRNGLAVQTADGYTDLLTEHRERVEQNRPELTEESTLSDYLTYAALNNPGLEAAFYRWKAALEQIPQVRALPDPRFNYAYFIREVETRVGPQRHRFGLSQMFPWFGKLDLQGDAALQTANAERHRFEQAKLELFYKVKNVYYEYYYLARAIDIMGENLELLTYFETVARTKYEVGAASYSDVIKAQVELGKLEDRLAALRDLRSPLAAKLNGALNRPTDASVLGPKSVPEEKVSLTDESLFDQLRENNPELKTIDLQAAKEKIDIELAKKNFYPDITLGMDYIETGSAVMPGVKDS
ncbi:MAG: TolC family protein, partial [bacterium]